MNIFDFELWEEEWEEEEWEEEEEQEEDDEEEVADEEEIEGEATPVPDAEDIFDDDEEDEPLGLKGKKALVEQRNEIKRLKKDIKKYQAIDLEEYEKIQAEKQKTEEQRLKDQAQWEVLSRKQERTIKRKDEDIQSLQAKVQQLTKETELKDYYYTSQGLQGKSQVDGRTYFDHVKDAIAKRTRREANGQYTVLDTEGFEQQNAEGKPMTLSELFSELRNDPFYGHYFKPKTTSGSGMTPGRNGSSDRESAESRWERLKKKTGYVGKDNSRGMFK